MRDVVRLVSFVFLMSPIAAAAEPAGCSVSKGLYEGWIAAARPVAHNSKVRALVAGSVSEVPDAEKARAIDKEYQAFFQCLGETAEHQKLEVLEERCQEAEADRVASLVCRTAVYVKSGRAEGKAFVDAIPTGKKAAELMWDVDAIAGSSVEKTALPAMFQPNGPAYKIMDELFLRVLDDTDNAAAKYFNIATSAPSDAARHFDDQMKFLLREAPSVAVKKWVVLRQYQPKLKKLFAEMTASLAPAELQKMRERASGILLQGQPGLPRNRQALRTARVAGWQFCARAARSATNSPGKRTRLPEFGPVLRRS